MPDITITASHPAIKRYATTLAEIAAQGVKNEGAVRDAFSGLLREIGSAQKLTLLGEQTINRKNGRIRVDGVLNDANRYPFGYWEAKDTSDDLNAEIDKKIARDYPLQNIIFEDTRRAVLYQNKRRIGDYDLGKPAETAQLLELFFGHTEPAIEDFNHAVRLFNERVPEHAGNLKTIIEQAHRDNKKFKDAFSHFVTLVREALNPNLSEAEVDEMLIQHLLTERIFREVFDMDQFSHSNVIAHEVEKVIAALTSKHFNKKEFLGKLDFFYSAIENAARTLPTFQEKQPFLNMVYERFFQGFAVKTADVLGIVYTPQEIVDFMGAAVEEVLVQDFGLTLADPAVQIIDPCTGTGGFIVNLLKRLDERHKPALRDVYTGRLFANEIALMPYYIASLNIEQAYRELTGEYLPFEGLCLVDTLGMSETDGMLNFFAEENTERIERQKAAPITVIIGNPPYNVGQQNENDNNKNRKYKVVDGRVKETYVKDSKATLKSKLYDPFVRFFRWATDRLGDRDGIIVYVTNNQFVHKGVFDGVRKNLLRDFTKVYHIDLHGDVRDNPKISGTTHNVFGIQVGVGITVAIRTTGSNDRKLLYHRVPDNWKANEKLSWLADHVEQAGRWNALNTIPWTELSPDSKGNWFVSANNNEFTKLISLGNKEAKTIKGTQEPEVVFRQYSLGVSTNRDAIVYDFDAEELEKRIQLFTDEYNSEVDRYRRAGKPANIDSFVKVDKIKWDFKLKKQLEMLRYLEFDKSTQRKILYRPFVSRWLHFDPSYVFTLSLQHRFFPDDASEKSNRQIVLSDIGHRSPHFSSLITSQPVDQHLCASVDGHQAFPFYTYDENGEHRRENITDWALRQFQTHYADPSISKWDIFYYIYAVLHHPQYRARFKDSLKRELPRIPFTADFRAFAQAGKSLADLHLNYETVAPYPLTDEWTAGKRADYRVEKMKWGDGKSALAVNPSLTLRGFPPDAFSYTLGGRSALDWVVEQYQVKADKRSGIVSDPNRYSDDERYIVDQVKRVTAVSVETVRLVSALPDMGFAAPEA